MLDKIMAAQQQMADLKQRLDAAMVTGECEGLEVTTTANNNIVGITIPDGLLADKDQLEDYLCIAINRALENAKNVTNSEMVAMAGSMFPGNVFPGIE